MLRFLERHKFGLLGTVLIHFLFLFLAMYAYMPKGSVEIENILVIDFEEETDTEIQKEEEVIKQNIKESNDNSNKAVNESAPKNVESGDYNEYNKEVSPTNKESFEKQLEQELKALEKQVIQEQRDAGYGYTDEEKEALLDSKKNKELETVEDQKPRSEAAFKGNTNITYKLKSRFDRHLQVPVYMCQYGGVVVINIAVNQEGDVISAKLDEESTRISDQCLIQAALKGAKNTKFNRSRSATKIQKGSITYRFLEQ
jgi:hypothetical protein